jgi:hypothetical protein
MLCKISIRLCVQLFASYKLFAIHIAYLMLINHQSKSNKKIMKWNMWRMKKANPWKPHLCYNENLMEKNVA